MLNRTLLLVMVFFVAAFSQAYAQAYQNYYQPYYEQAPATTTTTTAYSTSSSTSSSQSGMPVYPSSNMEQYQSTSFAFAPISDRIVSDPLYLPLQGQFYGSTGYSFRSLNFKSYNSMGAESTRAFNYAHTVAQTMAYGVTDDVELHVSESFIVSNTDTDHQLAKKPPITTEANANGFTDPTFGITYRAVDQRHNEPVDFDLLLDYAPNMMSASTAGSGHDGSENAGGQIVTFESVLGREMRNFTIDGFMGASYNGKRDSTSLGNDEVTEDQGYWNYFLGLQTQTRLTERFSINGDIQYNGFDNFNAANQTTGVTWIDRTENNVALTMTLNYHFIPNRLVGQLSDAYTVETTNQRYNNYSTPASDSYSSYPGGSNTVAVRLLYTFN